MKHTEELKKPFFAKLLEVQKMTPAQDTPGFYEITLKILDDIEHTQKYPSDNDEY
ncbi:MAG: microviridin/marinostatin family tricyclic proteinase inhibitor [Chitinophagaceae bacterium]|jgi:hypothetical protein